MLFSSQVALSFFAYLYKEANQRIYVYFPFNFCFKSPTRFSNNFFLVIYGKNSFAEKE